jgi:hypothetical protein
MRRSGGKPWRGAACLIVWLAPAAQAQDAGTTSDGGTSIILPELSVSAPADTAFFAPDTASQGVVTGKEIEESCTQRKRARIAIVTILILTKSYRILRAGSKRDWSGKSRPTAETDGLASTYRRNPDAGAMRVDRGCNCLSRLTGAWHPRLQRR